MTLPGPVQAKGSLMLPLSRLVVLIVSVSVALLLLGVGSVVPLGAAMFAVLLTLPATAVTVAFTVKVTLPPLGKVGMVIPAPCKAATVTLPGARAAQVRAPACLVG